MKYNHYLIVILGIYVLLNLDYEKTQAADYNIYSIPKAGTNSYSMPKAGQSSFSLSKAGTGNYSIPKAGANNYSISKAGQTNYSMPKPGSGEEPIAPPPSPVVTPPPKVKPFYSTRRTQKTARQTTSRVVRKPASKPVVNQVATKPKSTFKQYILIIPPAQAEPTPKRRLSLPASTTPTPQAQQNQAQQNQAQQNQAQQNQAQPIPQNLKQANFLCETQNNKPLTVVEINKQKQLEIILWESEEFKQAGYAPQERCKLVTQRFENYTKDNSLTYLTTGEINGHPVICFTDKKDGECATGTPEKDRILITLETHKNPDQTLEKLVALLQVGNTATQQPIQE